jgi:hypothetical protein
MLSKEEERGALNEGCRCLEGVALHFLVTMFGRTREG